MLQEPPELRRIPQIILTGVGSILVRITKIIEIGEIETDRECESELLPPNAYLESTISYIFMFFFFFGAVMREEEFCYY